MAKFFLIKSVTIIGLMLACNTTIAIVTLPELKRSINYYSVTWFIILMSLIWEVTLGLRLYIAFEQEDAKANDQVEFKRIMISYFAICEVVFFITLVIEILHQTILMRKRLLSRA